MEQIFAHYTKNQLTTYWMKLETSPKTKLIKMMEKILLLINYSDFSDFFLLWFEFKKYLLLKTYYNILS